MHRSRVEEWMSMPPIVISPTTTLAAAQSLMEQHHVHHLPVVQEDRLIGIVTAGDLRAAQPFKASALSTDAWLASLNGTTIAECMTHNPLTIAADTPVLEAARQMLAHNIGGLPVVKGTRVVGMITRTDLLRLLLADETRLEELTVGWRASA
jgi:CBS domain-containing protein